MAATITAVSSASSTTNGGSLNTPSDVTASVGDWLLIVAAFSNDGSNGGAPTFTGASDGDGVNTYTERADLVYDPGNAGAGAALGIYTCEVTSALSNDLVNVSSVSCDQRAFRVYRIQPGAGEAISFVAVDTTGSTGNATTHSAPTVSVTSGDMIWGVAAIETDDTITGDTDTDSGNWSTIDTILADGGADAACMSCSSQYKTVTATANQAWACTTASGRDSARTYIVLRSASTGVTADLSKTLGTLTLSSAFTLDTNTANLSKTLGAVTLSSAFTLDTNTADLSKTLGAVTLSSAFIVESLFSLSATLGAVTLSSTFTAGGETIADLSQTLGALTSSAAFTVETNADLSKTLGALSLVSAFSLDTNTADLAKTLGTLTLSAAFTVNTDADLAKTLGSLSLAASFSVANGPELDLSQLLGALTVVSSFDVTGGPAAEPEEGPHGPGWKLFGQDARPSRKRKVETLEQEIIKAYEDATGITAEREQLAAIRELKRAAATALSVAKKEGDEQLRTLAENLIGLKRFELTADAYLERAGEIIAEMQRQEEDDMAALILMARLA